MGDNVEVELWHPDFDLQNWSEWLVAADMLGGSQEFLAFNIPEPAVSLLLLLAAALTALYRRP